MIVTRDNIEKPLKGKCEKCGHEYDAGYYGYLRDKSPFCDCFIKEFLKEKLISQNEGSLK